MDQESIRYRQRRLESARQEIESLSEEVSRMNQALMLDKQQRGRTTRSERNSPDLLRSLEKRRSVRPEGDERLAEE